MTPGSETPVAGRKSCCASKHTEETLRERLLLLAWPPSTLQAVLFGVQLELRFVFVFVPSNDSNAPLWSEVVKMLWNGIFIFILIRILILIESYFTGCMLHVKVACTRIFFVLFFFIYNMQKCEVLCFG